MWTNRVILQKRYSRLILSEKDAVWLAFVQAFSSVRQLYKKIEPLESTKSCAYGGENLIAFSYEVVNG